MPKLHPAGFLLVAACVQPPSPEGAESPPPIVTQHLEVYGATRYQAERYEHFVDGIERLLMIQVAPMRIHQGVVPRCDGRYCVEDGLLNVYCDDLRLECIPALATAIIDQVPDISLPLLFRDGLVDLLAGGFGHGDVLDHDVERSKIEMLRLRDDVAYQSSRDSTEAQPFGDLTWRAGTIYPAGDFARFVIDELGAPAALRALRDSRTLGNWGHLGGFEFALEAWRGSPTRTGRMYRLPLVECDPVYRMPIGAFELPVMVQGVIFAPDLLESISRFGVANFTIESRAEVTITVTSSVGGNPFFRVESCGTQDPGPFLNMSDNVTNYSVSMTATLEPETYFLVAGSWTGESYAVAERPEHLFIEALPRD